MHRAIFVVVSFLVLVSNGCAATAEDSGGLKGGATCTALTTGAWTFTGAAWRMGDNPMGGDVTMDATACSFTLGSWSMKMDDLPSGGVVDGDQVQLDGLTSYWQSCTGTAADTNTVSGICADDGADWMMIAG